jgi:hypothetical protein
MSVQPVEIIPYALRDVLLDVAGADLAAIWLYGASVFGQVVIDVDLHILLHRQLTARQWRTVRETHVRLAREAHLSIADLDFWYISLEAARGQADPVHLAPWARNLRDEHWSLHRAHWCAGRCKVVHGLQPLTVVQCPSWRELEIVLRRELLAPQATAYWVLQLCRVWASLETRYVVRSKIDSGNWALERLNSEHHDVVIGALRCYQSEARPDDLHLIQERFSALLAEVRNQVVAQ